MFKLPALPFAVDALEPVMSRTTLETHHGKHHQTYIDRTNTMAEAAGVADKSMEEVVAAAREKKNQPLFNNSAQSWNHAFFWKCLTPDHPAAPSGALAEAINAAFGDYDKFRDAALAKGEGHFASGWLWLTASADGKVQLVDTHDAETTVARTDLGAPIFVCDVWEHAYYLDHKNARRAFLTAFFDKMIDWRFAEAQYAAARGQGQAYRFGD